MKIDFSKGNGLVPVVIQDNNTLQVLMVGYMNQEAFDKTVKEKKVTFFSRSKNRLWTKGETSGNFLYLEEILSDCDNDSILIKVRPA
ncbi:MAG: bifunctional phosphoribosyl-AMP cyclohydrolase/phosphoribosyl-ATP diphosphatase, partial [Bacteroidetes bacterium]|nr:bifunctional phosphoribosyl-AMP cyclohydrolase/phosphoribosyl-ATP diphosphatase [Bacteroidota bacterium]